MSAAAREKALELCTLYSMSCAMGDGEACEVLEVLCGLASGP